MENLLQQLLGNQPLEVWIAGMVWSLVGIALVKLFYVWQKIGGTNKRFSIVTWLNHNTIDVILGLLAGLVILRLEDYTLTLIAKWTTFEVPATEDFVVIMIVLSGFIQVGLHKKGIPLKRDK